MKDLKPCPFCGGEMYVVDSSRLRRFTVYHKDLRSCHFYSFEIDWQTAGSLKEAREAWNRRNYEQVEQKQGRWKQTKAYSNLIFCDECGEPFEKSNSSDKWNFCPNCGSYNGGKE